MISQNSARSIFKFSNLSGFVIAISVTICLILGKQQVKAQTPGLIDLTDIINTIDPEEPSVHIISFTLPEESAQINPTDYIRFRFDHYDDVGPPSSISGTYTGTPVYQVVGQTLLVSGLTIPPGSSVSFNAISTINPPTAFNFYVVISVTEDFDGLIIKNYASTFPILYDGQVDVTASVGNPNAQLQISGLAAPYTYVIFNEGSSIIGTGYTAPNGYYSRLFSGIPPGIHSISFYGIDQANRNTSTIYIDINTPVYERTTLNDQLLSPTIQVDDSSIDPGEPIYATGSAAPNTTINLFSDSPLRSYSTTADSDGNWTYTISDTNTYSPGDYRLYALAQTGLGLQSIFSPAIQFTLNATSGNLGGTACGDISTGDLNCDSVINLIDFSIMMYYWGSDSEAADINQDSQVGLIDFSIMMFNWGS